MKAAETPEGRSVRLLRVGEQVRHILSDILARGTFSSRAMRSDKASGPA